MTIIERVARFPYNFILRTAPAALKQFLWDREFRSGKWNFIDDTASDYIYPFVEKYARRGAILDLGCGPGNTANELPIEAYSHYTGVDISTVALEKARTRTRTSGRENLNVFEHGDLLAYVPRKPFNVIMARESLYHVPLGRVKEMFDRYAPYLLPDGVFIVKVITNHRYTPSAAIKLLESHFEVKEKAEFGDNATIVLVFRPQQKQA